MATADYLSSADLKAVEFGGLINEDVMQQIWDISFIPLPYMDMAGSDSASNAYTEWTLDALRDPTLGGWVVDGADSDKNDSNTGARIGNHTGILTKEVQVTERAVASNTIGRANEESYQVMMRQRELRRDVEANLLGIQGSQADNGDDTPGIPAGLAAMVTQFDSGSGATGGGFTSGAWTVITPGTGVALTETMIRDATQAAWEDGADPSKIMSVPSVIRGLSEYMFTSSARIATLTGETNNKGPVTAMGSVNVFLSDFGSVLDFVPNRLQQTYLDFATDPAAAVYILDPAFVRVSYLKSYNVSDLAKVGLSDKKLMSVDFTQKALSLDAHRVLLDINPALPVTQAAA